MKTEKKRGRINPASFVALLACMVAGALPVEAADVEVDWNDARQTIDGFGAAGGPFNKAGSIYRLPDEAVREHMLDLQFSRAKGIGMSILRNIVGDGGFNYSNWGNDYDGSADTIWPEKDAGFVWDAPDWEEKKAAFDFYQIWMTKKALERNPDLIILSTVWSPPHWMKTNNSVMGNDGQAIANGQPTNQGRLKPENYGDFAHYLAEYVYGYQREFGIPIHYISIANEPSLTSAYAHCAWNASEFNTFIRDHLGPTFAARNVPAKVMMPEHVNFSETSLITTALNDPVTQAYIDTIGTHAYGLSTTADAVTAMFPVTKARAKGLWQTEYMSQPSAENNIFENNLAGDGLRFSQVMSDMMNNAEINAYLCWWAISNSGADGSNLIRLANDGQPQGSAATGFTGTETGEYRAFKRFYTFGHFSRYVHPGSVRLGVSEYRPRNGVRISAFKHPGSGSFAIVAINQGLQDENLTLGLNGFPLAPAVAAYRTSDTLNHKKLADVPIANGVLALSLPLGSITTYVAKMDEQPDFDAPADVFSVLEAEDGEASAGLLQASLPDGGAVVSGFRNGDYVMFPHVNFADGSAHGAAQFRYLLSMHAKVAALAGGGIDVRVDAPDGPLVGFFDVPPGFQGWAKLSTPMDTSMGHAYGHRDLYLVGLGGIEELFHLDAIRFDQGRLAPDPESELIVNGGAETASPLGWSAQGGTGGGTVSRSTTIFRSGSASVGISNRSNPARGIGQSMTDKLEYGYVYDLSAWVRPAAGADTMKASLSIARTGLPALLWDIASVQAEAGEWTELAAAFHVPVPASMVRGITLIIASTNTTTSFNLDDVTVKLSPNAATIVAPSLEERIDALAERVLALGLPQGFEVSLLHDLAKAAEFLHKKNASQALKFMNDFLRDLGKLYAQHGMIDGEMAALLGQVARELLAEL